MKKQIEEMAKIIGDCQSVSDYDCDNTTCAECKSRRVYEEGYRKQSEFANQVIDEFKELAKTYLLNLDFYPVAFKNAMLYAETNLKKKYNVEG